LIVASRLCRPAHSGFDGLGGLHRDGRWHNKGHRVVYLASSEALAVLEVLVHLTAFDQLPEYVCVKAHISDDLILDLEQVAPLPDDWRSSDPVQTRNVGSRWLMERRSVVLRVPSVVIPREANFMLNPGHPDFERILVVTPMPFEFDVRLLGKRLMD